MNEQTKEALKMALEAMDCYDYTGYRSESELYAKAIQACKEALAQPTQYSDIISDGGYDPRNKLAKPIQDAIDFLDGSYEAHKIRKALQEVLESQEGETSSPKQEPVAWTNADELQEIKDGMFTCYMYKCPLGDDDIALYTHPAPTWQGLSDEEIEKIIENHDGKFWYVVCAIERALKDKNS